MQKKPLVQQVVGTAGLVLKRRARIFDWALMLSGLYAWWLTVFPVLQQETPAPWWSRTAAVTSLAAVVAIVLVGHKRLKAFLGIGLCFASGLIAWIGSGVELSGMQLTFGSLGWLVYTLAWGLSDAPLRNALQTTEGLAPRRPMRRLSLVLQAATTLGCLWLVFLPLEATRPGARIFSVLIVLLAGTFLQSSAAQLGSQLQHPESLASVSQRKRLLVPYALLALSVIAITMQY